MAFEARTICGSASNQLLRAGWRISVLGKKAPDGSPWWELVGWNEDRTIAVDGATLEEVWLCALEQARALGLLERPEGGK